MRTVHPLTQGSAEWSAHRARIFNASEACAAMGASKYMTRSQLLALKSTGIAPQVDSAKQALFDKGHAVEAPTIALIEELAGDELAPVVASIEVDGLTLGASYDGLTMMEDTAGEVKLWNEDLAAQIRRGELEPHYYWQLEQEFIVTPTLQRIIFATSDGTRERFVHMEYRPVPGRREQLIAAWKQFAADLNGYVPAEATIPAAAAPIEALPAISARIEGSLAVHSNLDAFGAALRAFIAKIPEKPTSDQEFADCDAACKALKKAEEALDGAEGNALGQVSTVEELTRTIANLRNIARTARLASEKVVKARKEQIRVEEVQRGQKALAEFIAGLNTTIGKPYMPNIAHDFGGAISGKKTLESLRAGIDQHLADKKIEANAVCARIVVNMRNLRELASEHTFLFADIAQLVLKAEDDCRAVIESRIAAHQAEEKRRAEAAAEKERERIRAEEQAKAEREARANAEAEQRAQVPVATQAPAPAPNVAPALSSKAPAANSPSVVPINRGTPTLRIGEIANRLGFGVTEAFLRLIGFPAVTKQGAACLYHEADFDRICDSLVAHIRMAQERQREPQVA